MLGAGLGFAIYHPISDDNPVSDLATGAVVVHGISAVFSLWFGGWVAGRFARRAASRRAGWLHGFLVWTSATIAGVYLVSSGAGWALGDISKLVGGGLSAAGKPAAAAVSGGADLAKDALKKSGDTISSYVDEAVGTTNNTDPAKRAQSIRAKREVGFAATRYFTSTDESAKAANRTALVTALSDDTGISQADAEKMVNDWTASYDRVKADLKAVKDEAAAKAREAAEKAAHALSIFSLCSFVAFVIGALAASLGGCRGAKHAVELEPDTIVVT